MPQHSSVSPKKKKPKADAFDLDAWLGEQSRPIRVCQTCADGGDALAVIHRWAERVKGGQPSKRMSEVYELVVEKFGYRWSLNALSKHVRLCEEYRARGR